MPEITIVMPLYNKELDVERAVRSAISQSFEDFELIVVNDGSTDKGPEVVRTFEDQRIRIFDQVNQGVSSARNKGIGEAKSDLIAFLDADDEWEKDYLEIILWLRDKFPSCEVFATRYYLFSRNYKRPAIIRGLSSDFREGILNNYFDIASQSDPPLWTSAVSVTKEAIDSVGGFPEGIASGEDLLTWARLAARYDIAYCNVPKAYFREPETVASRPGRVPQTPDIVGQELLRLRQEGATDRIKGLVKYLSLWHKMRANIFIRIGNTVAARREMVKAVKFAINLKVIIFYVLTLVPKKIVIKILEKKKNNYSSDTPLTFYNKVDRENVYTIEANLSLHSFNPILRNFIQKWQLFEKKCLEIGSSKGLFQDMVHDYTGVDVAGNLASHYHKKYVVVSDARLPFPDNSFDAIFTYATHEHIPDIETALEEIVRILKPGGVCLFAPAWHTRPWFAKGYQIRPFGTLSIKEKFIKVSIPFRDCILFRWPLVFLRRVARLVIFIINPGKTRKLKYKKLNANYETYWQSDSDACNSFDPFDVIIWFRSRKFTCHGYEKLFKALFVRAFALELQKPY